LTLGNFCLDNKIHLNYNYKNKLADCYCNKDAVSASFPFPIRGVALRMTTNPMSPHETFFRRLVTGKVRSAELPPTLLLADINGSLADLCRCCFDGPGEEKVEWGICIVLRGDRLHMPEAHRTQGCVDSVDPNCDPTNSDPEHREEYVGFAHTHPWVDGEPYPGFSRFDFRASLFDGDCLSLVCNGPGLFALVRTSDCTRPRQTILSEEFMRWQRIYDELIAMESRCPSKTSAWSCLWEANRIMCEKTGYALYYGDSWREAGALDLLYRPTCGEMEA